MRTRAVLLTFIEIENANIRDREAGFRLTLPVPQAARLWQLLGASYVIFSDKWRVVFNDNVGVVSRLV